MQTRIAILGWANSVHVQRWARGLAERHYDIKVISLDGSPLGDIPTTIIPRTGRGSYLTQAGKAAEAIADFKPDLVHAHYATGFGWWGRRSGFHPLVVSVWGADIMDFPTGFLGRAFVRSILKRADHITATSQLLRQVTTELYPAAESKLSVIPFGVNLPDKQFQYPSDDIIRLCFVKAHTPKYGPDLLLEAFAGALERFPSMELSLAGQGEMTLELHELAEQLGVSQNVKFVGQIPNQEIVPFVARHHFMVMPSTMASESFGVAVLEAGAAGRAVIASRIGGVPEVCKDLETGLLVEPGSVEVLTEAILCLAKDTELCRRMGENGRKFVAENYTWERSLGMMTELYDRLISVARSK